MIFRVRYMIVFLFISSVTSVFTQELISQTPILVKSVLTHTGSSTVSYEYLDTSAVLRTTRVQQSIGQHGTVGLSKTSLSSVQQGFLNHLNTIQLINPNDEFVELFKLSIFPNPFKEFVKVKFSRLPLHPIYIEVFDVRGRLVLNQKFQAASLISVPTERLEDASYIIRVSSGSQKYLKKLIKGIN